MKKILYISNIEVPYKNIFFNLLSKKCELTVLYERKKSKNRDETWSKSVTSNYKKIFLNGVNIKNENVWDFKIIKYLFNSEYDEIIFGCYNSPIQIFSILLMKLFKKKYSINIEGNPFLSDENMKGKMKISFLKGANKYYVAGEVFAAKLEKILCSENIYKYNFSSLTKNEIIQNSMERDFNKNNSGNVLVIGQYFDYKGLDLALSVAKRISDRRFKFIGMSGRSEKFKEKYDTNYKNIEIIPFLSKDNLVEEYKNAQMLILPSRKECWGLVVNEAASFGIPIVSTDGAGAAIEFLGNNKFEKFIAQSSNANDLYLKVCELLISKDMGEYSLYLINKSRNYSIEAMVDDFIKGIENNANRGKIRDE